MPRLDAAPRPVLAAALLVAAVALGGCDGPDPADPARLELPRFAEPALVEGRAVWMGTCRACHLLGAAGAPAVTDYANWAPRIAKGKAALYPGPLHGIADAAGNWRMPPRAGNDRLSDQQIEHAVDYMLATVEYLHARGQR